MAWPRKPRKWLYPQKFYFNFDNLQYAYGRYHCYLCFQVQREEYGSLVHVDMGVFVNQLSSCHVELCFLSWFYGWLSPDERYHVTWFMSWSPCSHCAQQVAEFLKRHSNVNLSIFAARLYHFQDPEIQEGLRTLKRTGVQVAIMYFSDFLYCWNNFVRHDGMRFIPWKGINKNYWILVTTLEDILRNTKNGLKEDVFKQQFGNQPRVTKPYRRRKTYLCYQLKELDGSIIDKDYFQNKKKRHAEIRFIDKIKSLGLDRVQSYEITCYITWSPCPTCALELVAFTRDYPRLSLQIFASRLYFHWRRWSIQGLQQLQTSVPLAVMRYPEFADCWENFVDHRGEPFEGWDKLREYSESIDRRLQKILRPSNLNGLENNFRNLTIGPVGRG
ncbi:DNA dC-_dU-editing enzyme APOBEC3-like [Diceros bicornis minor]|uniref:DNA dC->dU-editing enzyme APOBEC3-like n=1 Tax=Diceros bicornis minor TaxID=77932 RepID=UPI0026EA68E6|nr:DNA dC->dU-editing enzyme APOBEC3-like [Diceros bicornis minor]